MKSVIHEHQSAWHKHDRKIAQQIAENFIEYAIETIIGLDHAEDPEEDYKG